MEARRALFIANRKSGRADIFIDAAIAALEAGGLTLVHPRADAAGDLPAIIRAHADAVDVVVLGGGDGTMNHAAAALREIDRPLGLLPMGTANDLARTLGVPVDPKGAADIILAGATRRVDLGRVNDRLFFNVASVGLSVAVTRRQTAERKRRLRVLSYAVSLWEATRRLRRFTAEIEVDGVVHRLKAVQIAVGNGRYYGGGMTVADDAAIDDGRLAVHVITARRFLDLVLMAPRLRSGQLEDTPHAVTLSGQRVRLTTKRPMTVNTDGELTTRTPATFDCIRGAVAVFAPPLVID